MMILHRPPRTTFPRFRHPNAFAPVDNGDPGFCGRVGRAYAPWRARHAWLPPLRRLVLGSLISATVVGLGFVYACVGLWRLVSEFPAAPFLQTSRLYAQPQELATGDAASTGELKTELSRQGYVPISAVAYDLGSERMPLRSGTWRQEGDSLTVQLRRFLTATGPAGNQRLSIQIQSGMITRLALDGRPVPRAAMEPPLLASFYGSDVVERRPVSLAELPELVVQAVLAAEDDRFFTHAGLSLRGIGRALWINLRDHDFRQGGSTITQQLVKNLYCSRQRTLLRKAKEALLAMTIERRYDKHRILEAYLNSIYWGKSGAVNLIGIGAAARAYFGKDPDALTLDEAAELAAMIRAPRSYAPAVHPGALLERRNWVLQRMGGLGWASWARVRRAQAEPLHGMQGPAEPPTYAPFFTQVAAQEARQRFGVRNLAAGGYLLFSTLDLRQQLAAETAVASGLAAIEGPQGAQGAQRHAHRNQPPLEAALISLDPRDGAILAYVGGRDYRRSQFDRVSQAHRQLGSAFKPVVYAAAFEAMLATPATLLDDSPIEVRSGNTLWSPQNYDRRYRGWITARTALEQSINVPAVRIAAVTGLGRIAALARAMGLPKEPECLPAMALGAVEATPREAAEVYSTLATLGWRPTSHALAAVRDRAGKTVNGEPLPGTVRVLTSQTAYMVTSMLQGALDHGTGSGTRRRGVRGAMAGKTGTTSDRRDSWFAGYSPERATIVWVGSDDDAPTALSGASAAVPLWSRFTVAVAPRGGYSDFVPPPGMVDVTIDPATGLLAGPGCPRGVRERLPEEEAPTTMCRGRDANGQLLAAGDPDDPQAAEPDLQAPSVYAIGSSRAAWQPQALTPTRSALGALEARAPAGSVIVEAPASAISLASTILVRPGAEDPEGAAAQSGGPTPPPH
jgi:penicillin-binding protein 1B